MNARATNDDATALALRALAATLGEPKRAERFLALTGLDATELRERAMEPALLAATLGFLESHEPDLMSVADEIGSTPAALVAARGQLEA
ncbi:MAG: DUF3572 domain-containing protein [Pseudomonadota bacterium]|jgi:hypothetical protein|nr:DUF3572 domain-containing protein [Pseudomonadota bacterium]